MLPSNRFVVPAKILHCFQNKFLAMGNPRTSDRPNSSKQVVESEDTYDEKEIVHYATVSDLIVQKRNHFIRKREFTIAPFDFSLAQR